jgi:hypothetical protein
MDDLDMFLLIWLTDIQHVINIWLLDLDFVVRDLPFHP